MVITEYRGEPHMIDFSIQTYLWVTPGTSIDLAFHHSPRLKTCISLAISLQSPDLYFTLRTDWPFSPEILNSLSKKLQTRLILSIPPLRSNNSLFSNLTESEFRVNCISPVSWCTWKCCFYPMTIPSATRESETTLFILHVCKHVCIFVYMWAHVWGPEGNLRCHSSGSIHLGFWDRAILLWDLELTK